MTGVSGGDTYTRQARGHFPARGTVGCDSVAHFSDYRMPSLKGEFGDLRAIQPQLARQQMSSSIKIPSITFPLLALSLALWAGGYFVRGLPAALHELQNCPLHVKASPSNTWDITIGGIQPKGHSPEKQHRPRP